MKTLSKKSKEDLFLIFLLGGLFDFMDIQTFNLGYLIGSGLGLLIIAVPIGLILNWVLSYRGKNKPENEEQILAADLNTEEEKKEEQVKEPRQFKYGVYVAVVFVVLSIFANL